MAEHVPLDARPSPSGPNHPPGADRGDTELAEEVERICAELWDEPLFHLSLNSKELFHSNLLAWFIESYPEEASSALAPWTTPSSQVDQALTLREHSHLDLAIALPGLRPLVIENKVFSPPDDDQLDRYAEGSLAGFEDPVLLLLSLMEPDWQSGTHESPNGRSWRFVSYQDLAGRLSVGEQLLRERPGTTDRFAADLVTHYRRLVVALHELVQATGKIHVDDPVDIPEAFAAPLTRVRLQGAVGKLRTRQALREFRSAISPELAQRVRWESSFTNGTPLISAYFPLPSGDHLGWQYQQGQWRLTVVTGEFKGKAAKQDRHAYVSDHYAAWFDFEPFAQLTGRSLSAATRTELAGGFNDYNPDFVYRYRKAPSLTVAELTDLSSHYLAQAQKWAEKAV